jgi:hypothetical protein
VPSDPHRRSCCMLLSDSRGRDLHSGASRFSMLRPLSLSVSQCFRMCCISAYYYAALCIVVRRDAAHHEVSARQPVEEICQWLQSTNYVYTNYNRQRPEGLPHSRSDITPDPRADTRRGPPLYRTRGNKLELGRVEGTPLLGQRGSVFRSPPVTRI